MGIVADVASFGATRSQGKIAQLQAETQAKQEEAAGVAREKDRKSRLAEALASQNAGAGAKGIAAFEGSPLTIMQEDISREAEATQRDEFQTKLRAMTLRAGGQIARRQATTAANIGLLTDIEKQATKFIGD